MLIIFFSLKKGKIMQYGFCCPLFVNNGGRDE
ncbi:hypothetical protein CF65_01859 [Aggregatibacter actinomycetemcomitans HK1651]|nr:hypothetical protein CF65_01859 [Aggregatibacter actinomycetemcomitans HK1651]